MASNVFILKDSFSNWLKGKGNSDKTVSNYLTYLNKNIKELVKSREAFKPQDYLDNTCRFLAEGDISTAKSLVSAIYSISIQKGYNSAYISVYLPALKAFYNFICSNPDITALKVQYDEEKLQKIRESLFKKGYIRKVNGNNSLLVLFGSEDNFIKKAVSESYFFSAKCVLDRFDEISKTDDQTILFRRDTQNKDKKLLFTDGVYSHMVQNDHDGNKEVRKNIERYTMVEVSNGDVSTFMNYTISHIWGKAGDPRYFTNFWNIALVPSWANGPMDKDSKNQNPDIEHIDTLSKKMQDTYKAICNKLYDMKSLSWNDIGMNFADLNNDGFADRIKGTYTINIIPEKNEQNFIFDTKITVVI